MSFIESINKGMAKIENQLNEWFEPVRDFFDKHPELYKVIVVAMHFFRAVGMFALMVISPLPMVATFGIMLGFNLIYFAAVERFCPWKFALPSTLGCLA